VLYGDGVDRKAASELANLWHELPEVEEPGNAYEQMTAAARQFLPDSVERGSAGVVDGHPSIVAFDASCVFILRPDTSGASPSPALIARRYPLDADQAAVHVREQVEPASGALVRSWIFNLAPELSLTLRTYVRRSIGWDDGPSDSEFFARALAQRVGWNAPFERQR
jgi:hypothetical protein